MKRLCETEELLLRELIGHENDLPQWGASISVSMGFLQGSGYITRSTVPELTDKGREYLKHYGFMEN